MTTVTMQSAGDQDWFEVTLTAGVTYDFTESGLSNALYYSFLTPSEMATLNIGDTETYVSTLAPTGVGSMTLNYTADMTGAYFLVVNDANDDATGSYTFDAAVVADAYTLANPGTLSVGGSVNATMQTASDANWFKITLMAGVTYAFTESGLGQGVSLGVISSSTAGDSTANVSTSAQSGAGSQTINYTVDTSGAYYVEVRASSTDATGAYTLSAAAVSDSYTLAHPGTLTVGGSVSPNMESGSDTNWFSVALIAGVTYDFTESGLGSYTAVNLLSSASATDAVANVSILAPSGTAPQTINATVDKTGAYYVEVRDAGDNAKGPYTLSAAVVPDTYTLANPGKLTVGGSLNASMESVSDTNWFAVTLTAGVTYDFTESGLSASASFKVISATGAADSQAAVSTSAPYGTGAKTLNYSVVTSGTYYVEVRDAADKGAGPYTVSAAVVPDSYTLTNPGVLTVGGSVNANMQSASDSNWFKIALNAGVTYDFTAAGASDDSHFTIESSSLAADDVEAVSSSAPQTTGSLTVNYSVDTSGSYYVQVRDPYDDWTGPYTLSAAIVPNSYTLSNPGALTVGGSISPTIQSANDANWFSVTLTAGVTYDFTVSGLSGFIDMAVLLPADARDLVADVSTDAAGAAASETLNYTADTTGKYDVLIQDTANDATVSYTLSAAIVANSYTRANPVTIPADGEGFSGGGQSINLTNVPGNTANLSSTANDWDSVSGTHGVIYFTNAQASVFGAGDTINFAGGSGNAASLYGTSSAWDTVNGSGGIVYLTSSQSSVVGGSDQIVFAGGSGNIANLAGTAGMWDYVLGSKGTLGLYSAQASVVGGLDTIDFAGGSGNAVSLYATNNVWDTVNGSGGIVYLTSAQSSIVGGGDQVVFGGSGDVASLAGTAGDWDYLGGSSGTIYLYSAQASIVGSLDTIDFASGAGNAASLYATNGYWDTVNGSNGVVYLTSAQTSVVGGDDQIYFAGSGDIASLAATSGHWDYVGGSNGVVDLYSAQATVSGSGDTLNLNGASSATLLGGSDTVAFAQGIGGQDIVYDFASSDVLQFSKTDFANFAALSTHLTQSGANAVITLNASDTITLYKTTASSLTSSEFHFV